MNTYTTDSQATRPAAIISYSSRLYYRFNPCHRRCAGPFIEDLLAKREGTAAMRFFKRLLRSHGGEPRKIVTDKLRSYPVAHREVQPEVIHAARRYANNRAGQSYEESRVRERGMRGPASRKFKSTRQLQRFTGTHAVVCNLFNLGRLRVSADDYWNLREGAFTEWDRAVA